MAGLDNPCLADLLTNHNGPMCECAVNIWLEEVVLILTIMISLAAVQLYKLSYN